MTSQPEILNCVGGEWKRPSGSDELVVYNPATGEVLARARGSSPAEVDEAAQAAARAFADWRRTPATERVQYLFRLKRLLEENLDDLARTVTEECGKTYDESAGEIKRGIENVEVACGIPSLMQGYNNEDVARGIDEHLYRQPLGVVAAITPFNFPGMIPLWFLPYAIACGNTILIKPSDKTPLTMQKIMRLVEQTGLPPGVVNVVNGAKETVDAILDHPLVRAVSFVGSSPVARYVYTRATANGKRAQCQGGAKNPVIVMPDADLETVPRLVADSAFGCAGQRCLASSLAVVVGVATLAPFWRGIDTFRALASDERTWLYVSLPETLYFGLNDIMSRQAAMDVAQAVALAIFLVPYGIVLWRLRGGGEALVRACYHAMLFYLVIASGIFNPWYITWVMALAAPLADRAALVAGAFTLIGMLAAHRGPTLLLNFQRHWGLSPGRPLMAAVQFLPVLALWLALEWRRLYKRVQIGAKTVVLGRSG